MKQCRFCDADIPYYGGDTCSTCLNKADISTKIINDSIVRDAFKEKKEDDE
jgi:hypothetical protein